MKTQTANLKAMKCRPLAAGVAAACLLVASLSVGGIADATHSDPDTDHGWVSCSGVENAYATGYGNGRLTAQVLFESWAQTNASYYRYLTSPQGVGSGNWSADSNQDLIPSSSYGHCG